ncbi:MAG: phosphoenolpyruvate--protein phosphotransferase [Coriobacteriales bacterium]|jgi:phosphotransferase system enzyme I (PtsI)
METMRGVAGSPGIGIGRVMVIEEPNLEYESRAVEDADAELGRLHRAFEGFKSFTEAQASSMRANVGEKEAEILTGHIGMLADPYFQGEIERLVGEGSCAEDACVKICEQFAQMFEATGDELTMQRATDIRDIEQGLLAELLNKRPVQMSALPQNTVIVTHDLTPSMAAEINPSLVAGIVTETGGITSHSAILARAMGIPAVLSVADATSVLSDNEHAIIDGGEGVVVSSPTDEQVKAAKSAREVYIREQAENAAFVGNRTVTADGKQVDLFANISKAKDAQQALDNDAEGIGLFRTEFIFMDSDAMPTEEEQFKAYKQAALAMKGKPVIIRTLDVGGDKQIDYLGLEHEDNPFLGFRAVRFCLAREDVYRTQLRALLRASAFGDIRIMVPLVTCVDEMTQVRELVQRYVDEFDREGVAYDHDIKVGCMIETPAAAIMADALAAVADFFSIGTNDLTGYIMCADRGNDHVRYLYNAFNPAVLRAIRNVISAGNAAGIPVGMCGEAAADPLLVPLWISFGLDEYSVSPTSVLGTRRQIYSWSKADADRLADVVMAQTTATAANEVLRKAYQDHRG